MWLKSGFARIAIVTGVFLILGHETTEGAFLPDLLSRSLGPFNSYADSARNGGGWMRTDIFTNVGTNPVIVEDTHLLLLNPEDVGFTDIFGDSANPPSTNAFAVVAAAASLHPDYYRFGAQWGETTESPRVSWTIQSLVASRTTPFLLHPQQSFTTTANLFAVSPDPQMLIGEVIIGYRFSGVVVPEPGAAELFCFGLAILLTSMCVARSTATTQNCPLLN